ncbi:unnamed protein product [Rotaria magnacalcarata]
MRRLERVVSLNPTTASYCIRFRPKTSDDKHLTSIKNGSDCSSYACYIFTTDKTFILSFKVGRIFEGSQHLTLQMKSYCVDREAAIMHEFMRAFGFWNEQSRPDRDDYITIDFNNPRKLYHELSDPILISRVLYLIDEISILGDSTVVAHLSVHPIP